ncbi:MAG: VWA domain-containing protein [Phycisphaerae bacterium]|nr:VWA domain-containing protein [Phycisphaerae bacterium]
MRFQWDMALWVGLAVLAVVLLLRRRWRPASSGIRFSTVDVLLQQGSTWATRARRMIPGLRWLAMLVLVLAIARPQKGNEHQRISAEGIAIQMVLDVSSSMRSLDFSWEGKQTDRITAAKNVMREFIRGDRGLSGRKDDLIGLITFARYADSKVPLTLDHANLLRVLDETEAIKVIFRRGGFFGSQMQPVHTSDEDGTAIGDAIAVAVERLNQFARTRGQADRAGKDTKAKSKIIILLTDGNQTVPESMDPAKAAELAATFGYKIYVIGAGSRRPHGYPCEDENGQVRLVQTNDALNEEPLQKVAELTGGKYFRATDTNSLWQIYEEIDRLEKTKTVEQRYLEWTELATAPMDWSWAGVMPRVWMAMVLLLIEVALLSTRFRKIP